MNVVLFATRFAFEYSIELANNIFGTNGDINVYLFLPENYVSKTQLKQLKKEVKFVPFHLYANKEIVKSISSFYDIVKQIRTISPDIIHVQGSAHPYFWFFRSMINKIPIVDTVHDAKPHPGFSNLLQTFMRKQSAKNVKRWFVHGKKIKEQLLSLYSVIPKSKVIVIPKGHYRIFRNYTAKRIKEKDLTILFFGNITKYKGINILLEASEKVIAELPDVKFIIAGRVRIKDRDSFNLEKYKNHKNFSIKDYRISDEEVAELYQKATVIVLPYIEASQSGVLSIALGMGKAVIATKVGAIPEIIEHNKIGILIKPNDSNELSDAIIDILKNPNKRIKLKENVFRYADEFLSWERVALITTKVYQEVLNER